MGIISYKDYLNEDKSKVYGGSVLKKYNENLAKQNLNKKKNEYDEAVNKNLQNIKDLNLDYSLKPFSTGTDKTLKNNNNYLPTAENRLKAKQNQEIINNSQEVQNSREAVNKASNELRLAQYKYDLAKEENHTPTLWDKTIGVPIRATKDLLSMFSLTSNPSAKLYKDESGNKSFLPTANELRQQNVSNSYDTKVGKLVSDIVYNGTKILGSSAIPGGSIVYWGDMFNDSYVNTINDGYHGNEALLYATLSTTSELVTEKLMGGLSKLVPGGNSNLSKTINKTLSKVMKNDRLRSILSNALSEGSEEFVQEYVDLLNRNLVLGENNKFDLKTFENALYSGLVGMGTGGLSGAVNVDVNTKNTGIIPQINKNGVIDVETYVKQLQEAKKTEINQKQINRINEILNQLGVKTNTDNATTKMPTVNDIVAQERVSNTGQVDFPIVNNSVIRDSSIDLSYQGTNLSGDKANGKNITVDNMKKIVEKWVSDGKNSLIIEDSQEALQQIENVNGNPNAIVKIYRATPGDTINDGDWVFLDRYKAENFTKSLITKTKLPGYKVLEMEVRASDVDWTGKNLEFVYKPQEQHVSDSKNIKLPIANQLISQNSIISNTNVPLQNTQIHLKKGNIPVNNALLNKYPNVTEMMNAEINNYNGSIDVRKYIPELNNIDLAKLNKDGLSKLAIEIFEKYNKSNSFINDNNRILVSRGDIKESLNKIFYNRNQQPFMKEHLQIFSDLGDIIEKATLSAQSVENKNRGTNNVWSYYLNGLKINNKEYLFEFDVVSRENGENHYRVQRLQEIKKANTSVGNIANSNITPTLEASASYVNNDTIKPSKSQIAPLSNTSNMQNNQDNSINMPPVENNTKNTNITTKLPSIKYSVNANKTNENASDIILNDEQKAKLNELDDNFKKLKALAEYNHPTDKMFREKQIKGYAMEISAQKREIVQGDWLIPIDGGLTQIELEKKIQRLKSNYVGKQVIVDEKQGKIVGNSYGKVGVKFDDGAIKYFDKSQVTPVVNIDKLIEEQKALVFQYKKQSSTNQKKENIPIQANILIPVNNQRVNYNENIDNKKVLNPLEISKLRPKDANITPTLPDRTYNKNNDGNSHFFENIRTKTNMLNENQKNVILNEDDVKYYDKITNKVTLEKAFDRLNENGAIETNNWFAKDSEKATAIDVAEGWILLKQYADKNNADGMVAVAKKLRDIGTKAGQTVQAFNIMERMSPEGMVKYAQSELSEAYDKMVKNKSREWIEKYRDDFDLKPEEVSFIMKTMEEVQQMEDGYEKRVKLAEIQKVMTDKLPSERGAGIKAWMRISMLFNPKTQVRNVMGNAVIAPVNYFSDLFAGIVDKAISKKTGVRTIGKTDLKSYAKGFKTGLYQSYNDFKKGINTRDINGNRFEIGQGKSFNDNTKLGKSLNRVDSLLSFMLDAGDRGFYEASFTNSINNQLVLNNTTEVTQEMIDIATQEALSRTWQDNNGYTKFVLQTRNALNKINVKGYGLGDVLIPFAKTPANLTKAIVDYSPAGLIKTIIDGNNLKKSLTNGQYNAQLQHQFVQELGKATAGTMLYILGYALAKAGIVSGESDDDKDTRDFMKNTLGVSSYSIKIGNKSFTYDWAQPISAPLSIMANYVRKSEKNKDASKLENLISSLDVAGNILLQQSFMESINTVLSNNDGLATGIQEAIMELPSRAIPTLMKQIVDLTDSTQRQTFEYDQPLKTAVNKVKAKIPILSKTLTPSVDTMGREIQKYGGKNNIFNVLLNPANVNTENISVSAKEIYRLYQTTGEKNIMPRVAPYYINQNGEKITLDSKRKSEYQKISGSIIETSIADLLKNTKYKNMDDAEKAEVINKIVNYSYNKAREDVLNIPMSNEYNKINMHIADGGKVSDYYLNKEEIDYSYSYPEKYKTIKQITTYDKYLDYQDRIDNVKDNYDNTNQRKSAVINYVNSLKLSIPQKAMLIKLNYSSYDTYNKQIIEYIVNQKLTATEKSEILTKLGFTVKDGRVYY